MALFFRTDVAEYDDVEVEQDENENESEEIYAQEYPYVEPLGRYKIEDRVDRASSRQGRAHFRIVHKQVSKPKNYAKKYRTWMPAKEFIKPTKEKKWPKRMEPPHRGKSNRRRQGHPNRRRKIRPTRGNQLQRPSPPPQAEYDYFSKEEYFPEETQVNEFASEERRPPHKKHNMRRKPSYSGKGERYRPTEDYPSVSYSNFVQHPGTTSSSFDYGDFLDDEPIERPQKERRRKKKRRKGDRKRLHDRGEDQYSSNSESIEESAHNYEKYPPYSQDPPLRRPQRPPLPTQSTPIFGDGYIGHQNNFNRQPQNLNNRGIGLGQFESNAPQTFASQPIYNNFGVSHANPQPDIITQQNYNQFDHQRYAGNGHGAQFAQNQQVQNFNRNPVNYNQNFASQNPTQQITNAHTMQNIIPTNRGNEYSAKYNSNSFFDNTDSFQDFNQNANYNQVSKRRPTNFVPSTKYEEPKDAETEFINRHLDLYSNGMTGVPVQGDGRQELRAKDYDIGYGELQYDESHRT